MLPAIETFQKPVQGVAITWPGTSDPIFLVPFPGQRLIGALATGAESVVFVGIRPGRGSGKTGTTVLARYERASSKAACRAEVASFIARSALSNQSGRSLFISGHEGIAVIDPASLVVSRRIELLRVIGDDVQTSSWDERDGGGHRTYELDSKRWGPKFAGWRAVMIQFDYQVTETSDGGLMHVERWMSRVTPGSEVKEQCFHVIDWRRGTGRRGLVRSQIRPTGLDRIDPGAELLHVTRRQVALFRAAPPRCLDQAGAFACPDPRDHAVVLHLWPLDSSDVSPTTLAVRTADTESWTACILASPWWQVTPTDRRGALLEPLNHPSPIGEIGAPGFWSAAAAHVLPVVFEDPRDGLVWLCFADGHVRSIAETGRLGPMILLGGTPNVPTDLLYRFHSHPEFTFQGSDLIVIRVPSTTDWRKMARYVLRAADVVDLPGPLTLLPVKPGPLPGSHAKAFSTFVRESRHERLVLPDWSRDSVAAALDAQRAAVAAGLPHLVDPEEDKLTFSYRVAGKPVKEVAFFKRIERDALPVVPELRALLLAYTDQLEQGGEGAQPWQDPDEGVGGLGPALHALALLDPACTDVLRAYLDTRDGEHEAYCLDVVVPTYLRRYGWRDAGTVQFGIYAALNRFWGGRHPYGIDGLHEAMAELCTPEKVAATVRQEAEHFGRKSDGRHNAPAYAEAFRRLLDPDRPFDSAVLGVLDSGPAPS